MYMLCIDYVTGHEDVNHILVSSQSDRIGKNFTSIFFSLLLANTPHFLFLFLWQLEVASPTRRAIVLQKLHQIRTTHFATITWLCHKYKECLIKQRLEPSVTW